MYVEAIRFGKHLSKIVTFFLLFKSSFWIKVNGLRWGSINRNKQNKYGYSPHLRHLWVMRVSQVLMHKQCKNHWVLYNSELHISFRMHGFRKLSALKRYTGECLDNDGRNETEVWYLQESLERFAGFLELTFHSSTAWHVMGLSICCTRCLKRRLARSS